MLYIVATPIGNLQDLTARAKQILQQTELIIAENPTYSKRLLDFLGFSGKRFMQFAEHNESKMLPKLMQLLSDSGQDAVLISDAGTPGISDPGFRLVRQVIANGIKVSPVPGPNAAIAALSASGLPTDKFVFFGFMPKTEIKIIRELEQARDIQATAVFYESPHRILKTAGWLAKQWPDCKIVIGRELTKLHEEFIRGTATEIALQLAKRPPLKGELTVMVNFK